jgi:alcohol dehydrogenase
VRDYEGAYTLPRAADGMGPPLPLAPLACIPTTAGTGSEVSIAAVIKDEEERIKLELADLPMYPRLAILDPESTRTLPPAIAASTGMDAMTHAVEGYVSNDSSPHEQATALHALRLIRANLERAVHEPADDDARGNMLVAASLAITINLGAAHSMSHPCGGRFGVPHGVANAINLPHVVRFNAAGGGPAADGYRDVSEALGLESGGSDDEVGDRLATHLAGLVESLGLPTRLSLVGVPEDGIPALVDGAMGDGCTLLNPRDPSEDDFADLFRAAL